MLAVSLPLFFIREIPRAVIGAWARRVGWRGDEPVFGDFALRRSHAAVMGGRYGMQDGDGFEGHGRE